MRKYRAFVAESRLSLLSTCGNIKKQKAAKTTLSSSLLHQRRHQRRMANEKWKRAGSRCQQNRAGATNPRNPRKATKTTKPTKLNKSDKTHKHSAEKKK